MRRSQTGLTLTEILVAGTIGVIGIIIVMQVFAVSEARRRTTGSGADAQNNANIALYSIVRDLRQAGYGLSLGSLGCTVNVSFGGDLVDPGPFTLAPAVITDGGLDGAGRALPDTVQLLFSTATVTSKPDILTINHSQTDTTVNIRSNFGISGNSLVVFWEAGKMCALAQVTGFPDNTAVLTNNSQLGHTNASPWNSAAVFPGAGYQANAGFLMNLGGMALRRYSVDAVNNNLQVLETSANLAGIPSTTFLIASEIVNLQAEYGKDAAGNDGIVDLWDNVTPATGAGGAGVSGPWGQILAVRLAILARAGQFEKPSTPNGPCEATTTAPQWSGGTMAVPGGLPSCYRYKVFETTVPLRNVLWGWG
jgi:type IV pilus assembly protein PilW